MERKGNKDAFKRAIRNVIESFERAREWADLSNCLQRFKKYFEQNPGLDIPMKKDLAKRLAQCLNPDLNVIHQLTLEVYEMIFQRQIEIMQSNSEKQDLEWGSDLALFLSGLFNFYQFAAFEVKTQFLKIMEEKIICLEKELLLSLPGFMMCMLPALEDQNAQILKKVEDILKQTEYKVGTREFYSEIWKCLLKTPRARLSAIKYLDKRIPKDLDQLNQLIRQNVDENGQQRQVFTSKYTLQITQSSVELVKNQPRQIEEMKRIENMNQENFFYFYYPMKEKLVVNALLAGLADSVTYVNRGILDFLISHMPITSNLNLEIENTQLLEGALMTLSKKDFASMKKFFTWSFSHLEDEDLRPPDNDPAIKTLIPAIKSLFCKFILKNLNVKEDQQEQYRSQPLKILLQLFGDTPQIIEPVLEEISVDMIKYIKRFFFMKRIQTDVFNLFEQVNQYHNCIWMSLGSLLSKEIREITSEETQSIEAIELIKFCLKNKQLVQKKQVNNEEELSDSLSLLYPILSSLLSGVEKLSNFMSNLENAIPALNLIEDILETLDNAENQHDNIEHLKKSVDNFNNFYVNMFRKMCSDEENQYDEGFKLRLDTFKKSSNILNKIQKYSNTQLLMSSQPTMPEWLSMVIEYSKTKNAKIVLVSIETFLKILSKECHDDENDPIHQLQIAILRFSPNNSKKDQNIKIDKSKNIYENLQETENQYCKDIIQTLWSLLDGEQDHDKIVDLLMQFDKVLPKIFQGVVIDELNNQNRDIKDRAIKKFSVFWKLTAKEYDKYVPFQEKDPESKSLALHRMLKILEENDPTLRLSCKSWLSESKNNYQRILDPLILQFFQHSLIYPTYSGQLFFYHEYDTKNVIENFSKLRNIILNTQDEMISYIKRTSNSKYIKDEFDKKFEFFSLKNKDLKCRGKYLQTIVLITLQFIMGQAVESYGQKLYHDSQTVNASACEFMELILKSLESSQSEHSNEIPLLIIGPILQTFRQVIVNQNNAMQVHLLNLLEVLFFQCRFDTQESKADFYKIFKSDDFIESLVLGMRNDVNFVRFHFIEFTVRIIQFMYPLLQTNEFTEHVTKFIRCFCELLQNADITLFSTKKQAYTPSLIEEKSRSTTKYKKGIKNKMNQSKQTTKAKQKINQESDIIQIISGLVRTLYFTLDIKSENQNQANEDELQLVNKQYSHESYLGSKLKGFLSTAAFKKGNNIISNDNELKNSIFQMFPEIIISFLHCWNNLNIFQSRQYFFRRSGVFPYHDSDETVIISMIESVKNNQGQQANYQEYITLQSTKIQENIIDSLNKIAKVSPSNLIEGALLVYLDKQKLEGRNLSLFLEKLIQMLITLDIKPDIVINSVNKFIEKKDFIAKKAPSKKLLILQRSYLRTESQLCHFLYSYMLFNIQIYFPSEQVSIAKIYTSVLKFIKNFQLSKQPTTVCWLLEILYLLSSKYKSSEAYKQDKKLQREYQDVFNNLLTNAAALLSGSFNIGFEKQYGFKIGFPPTVYEFFKRYQIDRKQQEEELQNMGQFNHKQSEKQVSNFDDSFNEEFEELKHQENNPSTSRITYINQMPLPSYYDDINEDPQRKYSSYQYFESSDSITQFLQELALQISEQNIEILPHLILKYFKFFTIMTLKNLLFETAFNIHGNNHDKITSSLSTIVSVILQTLNNKQQKEDSIIIEALTDLLSVLMDKANQFLVRSFKREISEIFFSDNFFSMNKRTLRKWCSIINHFINDQRNEVFDDLTYKLNTQAGVFVSKEYERKQKQIALKRIAFLVFSGDIDNYSGQLDMLLKKMTEGFKTNKDKKELRIQLFLLSRVLLLRLKDQNQTEALRKLWPHLLTELVSIFEEPQIDYDLCFEAIKLIELMSCLNIEDFQMNQWIFLIDAIGMMTKQNSDNPRKEIKQFQTNQSMSQKKETKKGIFQPFIVKFIGNNFEAEFYQENEADIKQALKEYQEVKKKDLIELRKTSITASKEQYNLETLKGYAAALQIQLNQSNLMRTEIDRQNAEELIEKDFIEDKQL